MNKPTFPEPFRGVSHEPSFIGFFSTNRYPVSRTRLWQCLGVVVSLLFASVALAKTPEITVTSYGAAEKVSGSLHALDIGDTRVIIDCGLEYGEKQNDASEASSEEHPTRVVFPIDAKKIDAVSLRMPISITSGASRCSWRPVTPAPIYCTDATKQLLTVVMDSQIYFDRDVPRDWYWSAISRQKAAENKKSFTVHWMPDCPFGGKIYAKNKRTFQGSRRELETHFTEGDHKIVFEPAVNARSGTVDKILDMVKTVEVGETRELAPGVTFRFFPTGHIPAPSRFYSR